MKRNSLKKLTIRKQHRSSASLRSCGLYVILCISTKTSVNSARSEETDKTGFSALQRPLVCARLYKSTSLIRLYLLYLQVALCVVRILMC